MKRFWTWFDRMGVGPKAPLTSIDSLTFDLSDSAPAEQSGGHRLWMNAGVAHMLRFHPGSPGWTFDLTDPEAATQFYRQQCDDNAGVMLGMEVTKVAGVEALHGLFKYRAPVPGSLAMYFVGILWLPFQECNFQMNIEAVETGTTGIREAAVMLIAGDASSKPRQEEIPVIESEGELQVLYGSGKIAALPSDDQRYDQEFPHHPLSLVRARLDAVMATAKLDADARSLHPFRLMKR